MTIAEQKVLIVEDTPEIISIISNVLSKNKKKSATNDPKVIELAESANSELQIKSKELEKFNSVMLDREMRIIELKEEANKLAEDQSIEIPYPETKKD